MSVSDDEIIPPGWGMMQKFTGQTFAQASKNEEFVEWTIMHISATNAQYRRWLAYLHQVIFHREVDVMIQMEQVGLVPDHVTLGSLDHRYKGLVRKEMLVMPVFHDEPVPSDLPYCHFTMKHLVQNESLLQVTIAAIPNEMDPKYRRLYAYISQHLARRERELAPERSLIYPKRP